MLLPYKKIANLYSETENFEQAAEYYAKSQLLIDKMILQEDLTEESKK